MNVAVQMIVKAVQGNLEAPARQATTVERPFQSSSISLAGIYAFVEGKWKSICA
jgi:hypothetical protein